MSQCKLLFLTAEPVDTTHPTRCGEQYKAIEQTCKGSVLKIVPKFAVSKTEIIQLLDEESPTVVHFCGHGNESGQLVWQNSSGQSEVVSIATLTEIFSRFSNTIRIAIFNACVSTIQASHVSKYVDTVIGHSSSISQNGATAFCTEFYRSLIQDKQRTVAAAFQQARMQLTVVSPREAEYPQMFIKDNQRLLSLQSLCVSNCGPAEGKLTNSTKMKVREILGRVEFLKKFDSIQNFVRSIDHPVDISYLANDIKENKTTRFLIRDLVFLLSQKNNHVILEDGSKLAPLVPFLDAVITEMEDRPTELLHELKHIRHCVEVELTTSTQ